MGQQSERARSASHENQVSQFAPVKDGHKKAGESMKHQFTLTIIFLFIASGCVLWCAPGTSSVHARAPGKAYGSPNQERTAEQTYRNIQVFKGLPESQLLAAMQFMAG